LARKWKRDLYGNRIPEDYNEMDQRESGRNSQTIGKEENVELDWRDYIALTIASLETILLPIVIFIAVIVSILLAIVLLK
jgi:hypothetical protein